MRVYYKFKDAPEDLYTQYRAELLPRVGEYISIADTHQKPSVFRSVRVVEITHYLSHYSEDSLTPGQEHWVVVIVEPREDN